MSNIKKISDLDVAGKRVLVRVDFNVPLDKSGAISDDSRINAALPTIRHLVSHNAKVILASHLGRPKGKFNPAFSLKPVAENLAKKLGQPVIFLDDCIGCEAENAVSHLTDGSVLLLENVRFHAGEEKNDNEMSKSLANLADIFINDAFGTAHRAHASTVGVAKFTKEKAAGFLIEKELDFLGEKTSNPIRPFTVILGGAKVSDKIKVIDSLLDKADTILIGGGMAYTFKLAMGYKIGKSLCEVDKIEVAKQAIQKAKDKGVKFLLPEDNLIVDSLDFPAGKIGESKIAEGDFPDDWEGVDIGPKTIAAYKKEIQTAKTILWNGPMGIFEISDCSKGTFAIAEAVANSDAISIIGGGDSVKAINMSGYSDKVSFMSTGGGASLEYLEGKELPGVSALKD